jgi:hypothetical protein
MPFRPREGASPDTIFGSHSFKSAALRFIDVKSSKWRGWKSSQQWTSSLRDYVFPIFGHVDVSEIDTPLVMAALQPLGRQSPQRWTGYGSELP